MTYWNVIFAFTAAGAFAATMLLGVQVLSRYRRFFYSTVHTGAHTLILPVSPRKALLIHSSLSLIVLWGVGWLLDPALVIPAGAALLWLPKWLVKVLRQRREKRFIAQLPDALGAVAGSLKSGLNLTRALDQVVRNQPAPVAEEFSQVLAEYRMGRDLQEALLDLEARMHHPELAMLTTAVSISRSVGGNLGETLESLAETLRQKARVEGRIKALTAMGRAQGWLATGFPIVIGYAFYLQEPEAMGALFNEPLGWAVLTVIVALLAGSNWMIRKIIAIDV